jgi:hypothetical protein
MNPWHKKAREARGIEVIVAEFPGWLFLVRPLNKWNKGYQRALARVASQPEAKALLERQAVDGYEPTADDMELDARLALSAFAEGCLAGWSGVTGADGEALAFTPENAVRVLETFPEVSEALRLAAANEKNFSEPSDDDKVADILGNSVGASSSKKDRGAKRSHSAPAR